MTDIKLTEWTTCGGCAAKWGAAPLAGLVRALAARDGADPALIVGLAPFDDAAVYRLSDDAALVSTTDFFPPLVDDPSDFGAIAAANACSDVFAMGGRVVLALNISAFPERMPVEAVAAILAAAAAVVTEAGGTIAGGHTIRSEEPIFGLAVQGLVHPDRIWTKAGARPGDVLLLSKPIGTGILLAGGAADDKATAIAVMRRLNRGAAEALSALGDAAPRRHRRHRLRAARPRLGDGGAVGVRPRDRHVGAAPLRRGPGRGRGRRPHRRRRPQPGPPRGTGGVDRRPRPWRPWPTTRRRRGDCWPRWHRRRPTTRDWPRPASWPSAGWWRVRRASACCNGEPAAGDLPILCVTATADG